MLLVAVGGCLPGAGPGDPVLRVGTQPPTEVGVVDEVGQGVGERAGVSGGTSSPRSWPGTPSVTISRSGGRSEATTGTAQRHRLDRLERRHQPGHRQVVPRHAEHVDRPVLRRRTSSCGTRPVKVVASAMPRSAARFSRAARAGPSPTTSRCTSCPAAPQPGDGVDQHVDALVAVERADGPDRERPARRCRRRAPRHRPPPGEVDAVGDDRDPCRGRHRGPTISVAHAPR